MRPGPRRSLRGLLLRSRGAAEIRAGAELGGRSDRGPEALPVSAADTPPGLTLAGLPEIRAEILAGIWKPCRCRREDESPACVMCWLPLPARLLLSAPVHTCKTCCGLCASLRHLH